MSGEKGLFERLKERGDEMLAQLSGELMQNRHFVKAMEGALRGKRKIDEAAARALRTMNIPTRSEFKKALARLEALEGEVASLKAKLRKAAGRQPGGAKRAGKRR